MRKCPKCKLINPDSASRCDCGWDFVKNQEFKSYIPEVRNWQIKPWYKRGSIAGLKMAPIGAAFGWFFTRPQISSTSKLFGVVSEEDFIKGLMAIVVASLFFIIGFVWGVIRKNKPVK